MAIHQVVEQDGQKVLVEVPVGSNLATSESPGAVQPDGVTMKVDSAGILSAIGGNLLMNSEEWITESGDWEAPVTGWYAVLTIDGGSGGASYTRNSGTTFELHPGASGAYRWGLVYLEKDTVVQIVIGAGGPAALTQPAVSASGGGSTTFGDYGGFVGSNLKGQLCIAYPASVPRMGFAGAGFGGGSPFGSTPPNFYGGGGGVYYDHNAGFHAADGAPGVVWMRWHDPAKAAGPVE